MDPSSSEILIGTDGPERLEGRAIRLSLPCQRCRYDLRGLSATGVCPECGLPASRSLEAAIDPTTHRLPPLLAPQAVGAAIVTLGGLALVGGVALAFHLIVMTNVIMELAPGATRLLYGLTMLVAVLCGLVGWFPVLKLWPSPGTIDPRQGRRGLGWLSTGLAVWTIGCGLVWWLPPGQGLGPGLMALVPLLGSVIYLVGLRRIVIEVGTRSRLFRTDQIRRQRIMDLVIGIVFIGLGIVLTWMGGLGSTGSPPPWWSLGRFTVGQEPTSGLAILGLAMLVVASVLVLVGLIYLCVNLRWVRRALQSPPPRLREFLDPPTGS
ncbi:MAG: hypothetical protein MK116_02880 [Phycisphaerales bacterium]|nr:hypothetical protein [Phycisphaerales bacterium]